MTAIAINEVSNNINPGAGNKAPGPSIEIVDQSNSMITLRSSPSHSEGRFTDAVP